MKISAIHHRLGSRAETLADLCEINPDWQLERLVAKTGIVNRHVIGENDTALGLAEEACLALFRSVDRASIDGLIYVTQSPESTIPATACLLHESLQLPAQCLAFDLIMANALNKKEGDFSRLFLSQERRKQVE